MNCVISFYSRLMLTYELALLLHRYNPMSMAARLKFITVFGWANSGFAGSNPAQGMLICVRVNLFVAVVPKCGGFAMV
jgi:hypothetical protein